MVIHRRKAFVLRKPELILVETQAESIDEWKLFGL